MEKFSVRIDGQVTSITMEPLFREELDRLAESLELSRAELVRRIAALHEGENLSSDVRCWILAARIRECNKLQQAMTAKSVKPQLRKRA